MRGIPTLILFRDGEERHRIVGASRTGEQILEELGPHLS
ncbi:MAG: thioredoxin family protein [Acidobacteria bacterium]|nr:thioredoxin family protein [Acidobacteriota bacterium]